MLNIRALFFRDNEEFGQKCIAGQPPRQEYGSKTATYRLTKDSISNT